MKNIAILDAVMYGISFFAAGAFFALISVFDVDAGVANERDVAHETRRASD